MLAHGVPAKSGPGRLAAVQQSSGTGRPGSAPSKPDRRAMVPPSTPRLSHCWPVRAATSAS